MKQTEQEYCETLSTSMRATYNSFGDVFCPVLGKTVTFDARGFHHLHYKPGGSARKIAEKIHKLTLVPLANVVVKNAVGIYDQREVEMVISRKKDAKPVKATQYALSAIVGKKNPIEVRVIIIEIENAPNPIFWSIMKH